MADGGERVAKSRKRQTDSGIGAHESDNDDEVDPVLEPVQEDPSDDDDQEVPQVQPVLPPVPQQPHVAMAGVTGSQLNSIPQFDGATDSDVEVLTDNIDAAIITYAWEEHQACGAAKSRLTGLAAKWLRSQGKMARVWNAWNDVAAVAGPPAVAAAEGFKTALKTRFLEMINEIGATNAVVDLKQKPSENVDDFYDRCVLAMDRKNQALPIAQRQGPNYQVQLLNDVYTWFGAGLKEEIRAMCLGGPAPPITADTLLRAAKNAEKESQRKSSARGKMMEEVQQDEEVERGLPDLALQLEELRADMEALKSITGMAHVECYRCKKMGHYSFNCPNPKAVGAPRGRGAGRGAPGRGRGRWSGGRGKGSRQKAAHEMEEEEHPEAMEELDDCGSWQWTGPPGNE